MSLSPPRPSNAEYYSVRLKEELRMAEECADPGVARIHRDMASLYEKFIAQFGDQPIAPPPLRVADDDQA